MNSQRKKSVHQVLENRNCMGCGFCEPLCPEKFDAIRIQYIPAIGQYGPIVDDHKCTECGICLNMCPGEEIDYDKLNIIQFGEIPKDKRIGQFLHTYSGYSTDNAIREGGASGGVVTQLLAFALEQNLIDRALVVRMNAEHAFEPEFLFAASKDELLKSQKSQYLPVPLGVAFRKILAEDIRVGIVGLPCHLQALRKSQVLSRRLRERVIYSFWLFCFGTTRRTGIEYFLRTHGIHPQEVASIVFRDGTYPGRIKVKLKDGNVQTFNRGFNVEKWNLAEHARLWTAFRSPFYMDRCFTCTDGTAELSDISFGDPWLPEFKHEQIGQSLIVVRSEKGAQLVQSALAAGKLAVQHLAPEKVYQSQGNGECISATRDMRAKSLAKKLLGQKPPEYKHVSLNRGLNPIHVFFYIFQLLHKEIAGRPKLWSLLQPAAFVFYGCDFIKRSLRKIGNKLFHGKPETRVGHPS